MEETKMNIKALIKKYEAVEYVVGIVSGKTILKSVLKDLKQLDEPQKVKVPRFVADWISFAKINGLKFKNTYGFYEEIAPSDDVYRVMYYIFKESIADKGTRRWAADNVDTFARAWLDGYEVEEERRYYVKITAAEQYLVRVEDENFLGFLQSRLRSKFTRKQLEEAGFGWVFDCPGIEIEEVE
jgi:hypothetical protein